MVFKGRIDGDVRARVFYLRHIQGLLVHKVADLCSSRSEVYKFVGPKARVSRGDRAWIALGQWNLESTLYIYIYIYRVGVLQLPSNKNRYRCQWRSLMFIHGPRVGGRLFSSSVKKMFTVGETRPISDANERKQQTQQL